MDKEILSKSPGAKKEFKNGSKETSSFGHSTESSFQSYLKNVVLVIGATLIAVAAFRNSLTWPPERFWSATGDFWQAQWEKVLNIFGEDPYTYVVYGGTLLFFVVYWICGIIFLIFDISNKSSVIRRYKVQPGTNEPLDTKKLPKVLTQVLINQTVVSLIYVHLFYQVMEWRGIRPLSELPSFHRVLVELAAFIIMEEILFYYSHRLLHHRFFYRFIHKIHHEWTSPIAITAVYCHPIEHVVSNLFPVLLGPCVMKSHITTMYLWVTLALLFTTATHSGYHLPFYISPEDHDFHHQRFNYCYGVLGVLDFLHGTDAAFRKTVAFKRHKIMFTFKPPREIHPDEKNSKQLNF